jgi:zinc transport system permease protein
MYLEFMWIAACAAVGMAIMAGILGCFVVWRRMAYFGDALSHASVLGVAVSLGFGFSVYLGVAGIACLVAILLWGFVGSKHSADSLLGVISHGALAIGLIAAALWGNGMSLEAVLFGDILVLEWRDALYIWAGVGVIGGYVLWRWRALILSTLGDDLAASEGVDAQREQFFLALALALLVGLALQVVGAILITAFLIIPAAAARTVTRTPEAMGMVAVLIGVMAVLAGLVGSYYWDTPAGPSMVVAAAVIFVVLQGVSAKVQG